MNNFKKGIQTQKSSSHCSYKGKVSHHVREAFANFGKGMVKRDSAVAAGHRDLRQGVNEAHQKPQLLGSEPFLLGG